jgi:hypothetical protein
MAHPAVTQLRFTRSEWIRGLKAVTPEEAARHIGPINPIAWMIGHLAWQEQLYFLERAQGLTPVPEVKQFGFGKPLTVPPLDEAWQWWRAVTKAADPYLDTLKGSMLTRKWKRETGGETPAPSSSGRPITTGSTWASRRPCGRCSATRVCRPSWAGSGRASTAPSLSSSASSGTSSSPRSCRP